MSDKLNPENKCSDLEVRDVKVSDADSLMNMLIHQERLQRMMCDMARKTGRCKYCPAQREDACMGYDDLNFMQRIRFIEYFKQQLDHEFSEMMERLPYKLWKEYSDEAKSGEMSIEQMKETEMELVDMLHFYLNIILFLMYRPGNTRRIADRVVSLFFSKNKENVDRQNRGY